MCNVCVYVYACVVWCTPYVCVYVCVRMCVCLYTEVTSLHPQTLSSTSPSPICTVANPPLAPPLTASLRTRRKCAEVAATYATHRTHDYGRRHRRRLCSSSSSPSASPPAAAVAASASSAASRPEFCVVDVVGLEKFVRFGFPFSLFVFLSQPPSPPSSPLFLLPPLSLVSPEGGPQSFSPASLSHHATLLPLLQIRRNAGGGARPPTTHTSSSSKTPSSKYTHTHSLSLSLSHAHHYIHTYIHAYTINIQINILTYDTYTYLFALTINWLSCLKKVVSHTYVYTYIHPPPLPPPPFTHTHTCKCVYICMHMLYVYMYLYI
jgi:hypothetical protein